MPASRAFIAGERWFNQTLTRNLTQKHHPLTIHSFYFTLPSASHHPLDRLVIHSLFNQKESSDYEI